MDDIRQDAILKMLPQLIELAICAGKAILPFYKIVKTIAVSTKSDDSPVTQADFASHAIIKKGLQALDANIPILSEEGRIPEFSERQTWSRYWLVDPLDGTRGFIRGSDEFTVNIALIDQHSPVLGVIYRPVKETCYYAAVNQGAFIVEQQQQPKSLHTVKQDENCLRLLCGRFDRAERFTEKPLPEFEKIKLLQMNSSIKFPLIASGEGDVYLRFGPTSEWDTAAGDCILSAAGGRVVDFQGKSLQYNAKSSLINPSFLAMGDPSQMNTYLKLIDNL